MSVEDYAQKHPLKAGVVASLIATGIWWFGGKVLTPFLEAMSAGAPWVIEWVHDLGWLFFLLTLTFWFLFGRTRLAHIAPSIGSQPSRRSESHPLHDQPTISQPQPLVATTDSMTGEQELSRVSQQSKAAARPMGDALLGELKWRVRTTDQSVSIEVINDHVRDEPKRGIVVRVDDLRRWVEEKLAYVAVEEVVRAKPPFELQLVGGSNAIFYGGKQLYAVLPISDQQCNLNFNYRRKEAAQFFKIRKGIWRATVTVEWSNRAETRNVCFRLERPRTTPEILECPVEAVF